ncbi:hypothetical protein [Klebsiella pneumoniae]|uniref:hypothetical protein n=1 Tax=Klebsiella pneumoniae TaxID=573 RepID=UPI001FAC2F73|nr:hypothetical protein [Klebsiella pneumoniae]MCI8077995.1 hypothetical protein [Klebsiella pneumoniae]
MTITLQAVNELIQSLESAGELSLKETKVMALAKAYQQLAAENALRQEFVKICFRAAADGASLDGSDIQEIGERLGLFGRETYQPMLHGYICGHEAGEDSVYVMKSAPATDRIVAGIKASTIPEGFKLVPEQMYLSDEDIQAICMQCGNGDKKGYGDYEDGILWVGELSNDGEMKYGLNIANANYPEEGSITVFEFDEPLREVAK